MQKNSRLVYSTENGRICPNCGNPKASCSCRPRPGNERMGSVGNDGIVRIQKETKGRKGKCVCVVYGLAEDQTALKKTAKALKNACGSGGSVKDGTIIIQGDHRLKIKAELEKLGHTVKLSGG